MEKERLLIARFIREHPQFRYTIKYDEYDNRYILHYKTEVAVRSMTIPSGISYEVLLKKFDNGINRKKCDICFECDAQHYMICHMCAFRMCKECFVLFVENDTNNDVLKCPQCRTIMVDYARYVARKSRNLHDLYGFMTPFH